MLRRTDPEGYAASAEALATVNLAEDAGSLDLPTLVMVGEADHSTPIGTATGLRDAISGARLKTLPGLAHLPPAEAPAVVAAAIVEFLDSLPRQNGEHWRGGYVGI